MRANTMTYSRSLHLFVALVILGATTHCATLRAQAHCGGIIAMGEPDPNCMERQLEYHEVVVTPATVRLHVGEQATLRVKKLPVPGDPSYLAALTWMSSDTSVVSVDSGLAHGTARLFGRKVGTATVSATLAGFVGRASVTVEPQEGDSHR